MINGDDIITDLLSVNRFTIRYIDTPARPLLKRIEKVHTNRVIAYKVRRDILRIPRPAVWHAVPHEWAAAMYGLGCSMSILSRSTCVRILWDKHMHGWNLAKHSLFTDDTTCPLCGGADSQYHIIRECHIHQCAPAVRSTLPSWKFAVHTFTGPTTLYTHYSRPTWSSRLHLARKG